MLIHMRFPYISSINRHFLVYLHSPNMTTLKRCKKQCVIESELSMRKCNLNLALTGWLSPIQSCVSSTKFIMYTNMAPCLRLYKVTCFKWITLLWFKCCIWGAMLHLKLIKKIPVLNELCMTFSDTLIFGLSMLYFGDVLCTYIYICFYTWFTLCLQPSIPHSVITGTDLFLVLNICMCIYM